MRGNVHYSQRNKKKYRSALPENILWTSQQTLYQTWESDKRCSFPALIQYYMCTHTQASLSFSPQTFTHNVHAHAHNTQSEKRERETVIIASRLASHPILVNILTDVSPVVRWWCVCYGGIEQGGRTGTEENEALWPKHTHQAQYNCCVCNEAQSVLNSRNIQWNRYKYIAECCTYMYNVHSL